MAAVLESTAVFAAGLSGQSMTFEITTTRWFSAAHQLRLYDGALEPVHGHNWKIKVIISAAPRTRSAS